MVIQKAVKQDLLLRMALGGVTGGGKTWSGLEVGSRFAKFYQTGLLVIDTEHDSASLYADEFEFDKIVFDDNFAVDEYIEALHEAHRNGYGVVMIDSLSHAWMGKGGLLQFVDDVARRNKSGNKFAAWSDATPKQLELVETILTFPGHLIATMRSKMEYVLEEVKGKQVPRKVGMALQQRDGIEYEFSIVGEMTLDHDMIIGKSRCRVLTDEIIKPTKRDYDAFCSKLITWLGPSGLKERREQLAAEHKPAPAPAQEQPPTQQSAPKPESGNGHSKPESGDMFDELKWLQTYEDMLIKSGVTHEKVASICRTATGKGVDEIEKASPVQRRNYKASLLKNLKEQGIEIS